MRLLNMPWPSIMIKAPEAARFLASFFRTVPHSAAGRTILCPLCSPHPQNQSEEKKTLSTQAFLPHFSCFRALAERTGRCYNDFRSAPPRARARSRARAEVRIRAGADAAEFDPGEKRWKKTRWQVRCWRNDPPRDDGKGLSQADGHDCVGDGEAARRDTGRPAYR